MGKRCLHLAKNKEKKKNNAVEYNVNYDADMEQTDDSAVEKISAPVQTATSEKAKKEKKKGKDSTLSAGGSLEKNVYFGEDRRTVRELLAFEGMDTSAEEFVKIINAGQTIPTVCMYIHKMPKSTTFASSYVPLFNFSGVTTSIFINPMKHDDAQKVVDGRVSDLTVQVSEAQDAGDVNQVRKMENKLAEANAWAAAIERGDNALYLVKFLFVLQELTVEDLERKVNLFHSKANEIGFDVVTCYATHHQAIRSQFPLNRPYAPKGDEDVIKAHCLDKNALLDIFNHTENSFIHKDGVFAGHYINGNKVFLYDPYDKSHTNHLCPFHEFFTWLATSDYFI